jgi:hypothetical protein
VASKVFKSYADFLEGEENNYKDLSLDFERMAVDILQECYEANQEDAELILLRQIPELGNSTALQIAYIAGDKNFVSSSCYQLLLAKLWYGQIYLDEPALNVRIFNLTICQFINDF